MNSIRIYYYNDETEFIVHVYLSGNVFRYSFQLDFTTIYLVFANQKILI